MLVMRYLEVKAFRSSSEASSYAHFIQRCFFKARSDLGIGREEGQEPFSLKKTGLATRVLVREKE